MSILFLDALHCKNNSRPPIWLMRQAGRYMPEYRDLRKRYSFLEMCHQPELIAEVTQLPIKTFGFDAAILFSDILLLPEALDVGLHFDEGIGPIIDKPLRTAQDVAKLPKIDVREKMHFVAKGIKILREELTVPLIGFCGAPFTVASYLIEGKSSKDLKMTKKWMLQDPISFHQLLNKIADYSIEYLQLQVAAGVQAIQIFDSWAQVLGPMQFKEFSLSYLNKIQNALKPTPSIIFCRGASTYASQIASIKPRCISLDWQGDITQMRSVIPADIALQGNLDPDILYGPMQTIANEAGRILKGMRGDKGFIFNLGHGILPDTPVEAVQHLIETVRSWTPSNAS